MVGTRVVAAQSLSRGMNDVTTATSCAASGSSARIFWESTRALIFLAARIGRDQRFALAS